MIRERITSSSNVLKERRNKSFVKFLWFFLLGIILLIALAFISRIDKLLIKDVSVSGNEILKSEDLKDQVFKSLSKKVFLIFEGRDKFLYSKKTIIEDLKNNFPRILDVEVDRQNDKIILNIRERERAYLWCGEVSPEFKDRFLERECYFLDASGFIFDKSPQFSSGVYFTFYSKINEGDPIGQYVLDFEFLKNINLLVEAVEDKGLPVHSLVEKEDGQYELLLNMETTLSDFPKLLFTSDQTIDEVYNKFLSIVDENPFKKDFLEKREKLEYIDARFKNRIFYRFAE